MVASSINYAPNVQIKHKPDGKTSEIELIPIDQLVDVRGWKAIGSKLNYPKLSDAKLIDTELTMPETEDLSLTIEEEQVEEETSDIVENAIEKAQAEAISVGQKITLEEEIKLNPIEDIPLEIKNYDEENISKDTNKGEQLGLF